MQKLMIIGNLTKDPVLRHTQDGAAVCGFTVAVNRKKNREGEPAADFFNVNAWQQLGENCAKYLEKGRKVAVVGRVSLRTWDTDGKHGASLEVQAEDVEFLSSRTETAESPAPRKDEKSGMEIVDTDGLPY